ncbi:hypothetical protein R5R35_013268 [Gryllus longicercus]|uniref:Cadherin domain-containing protein n=1 Tax=Gryllus longicercus TaxID=2509291 RepID=A0AAN9ZFS5_9ORTH
MRINDRRGQAIKDESVEVVDPSESPTFYFPVNKLNLLVPATLPRGSILFRTKALPLSDNSSGKTPSYHSLLKVPSWLQIDSDELDLVVKLRRNATPSIGTVVVKIEAENTTVDELPHDDSLNEVPLNVLVMELTVLNENSTRVLCAADNSTENLCFWPFVSWRVLEEEPEVSLSSPGPEYLQRFCNRTFQYRLAANDSQGSSLAVTKDKSGVWQLQTVRPLDRELATNDTVDAVVARAQLLCSEMGTDDIPKMKPRTISSRNISVELIDRDDNPPEGQNKVPVYLETNVLVQGAEYAKNALLLQDSDSDLRQRYQISIVEDPSELWLVRCGPTTELKFKWPFPHAIISCYLTPRENRTLAENSKHNITLLVQDITMEHIRPHVDNNVLLSLSLVAGPRPRDPTASAAASAPAASAAASSDAAWRPRYPRAVALARWVAPLARVARPRARPRANAAPAPAPAPAPASGFRVEAPAAPGAFAVTRRQGIVYVKDPDVLARAPDSLM